MYKSIYFGYLYLQPLPERVEPQQNFPSREATLLRESFGLTGEDLMNIQRLAQERIEQELRSLTQEDMNADSGNCFVLFIFNISNGFT